MSRWRLLLILGIALWIGLVNFAPKIDLCYFSYPSEVSRTESYRVKEALHNYAKKSAVKKVPFEVRLRHLVPGAKRICADSLSVEESTTFKQLTQVASNFKSCCNIKKAPVSIHIFIEAPKGPILLEFDDYSWFPEVLKDYNHPCATVTKETTLVFHETGRLLGFELLNKEEDE